MDRDLIRRAGRLVRLLDHEKRAPRSATEVVFTYLALTEPRVADFMAEHFGAHALCHYLESVLWEANDQGSAAFPLIDGMEAHVESCRRCQITRMINPQRQMIHLVVMGNGYFNVARLANMLFNLHRLGDKRAGGALQRWLGRRPTGEEAPNISFQQALEEAIGLEAQEIGDDLLAIQARFPGSVNEDQARRAAATILGPFRASMPDGLDLAFPA